MHSLWNLSVHQEPARVPWPRSYTVNPCASCGSCTLKPRPLWCHCNSPTSPTAKQSSTAQFRQRVLYVSLYAWTRTWMNPQSTSSHARTTLHAWQDHDRNSRQGQTGLHLKRDCHCQTTDYHNFQRQHPWTQHQLCKPHALFAASTSRHATTPAQLCQLGGDMTSVNTPCCNIKAHNTNSTVAHIEWDRVASGSAILTHHHSFHCHSNGQKLQLTNISCWRCISIHASITSVHIIHWTVTSSITVA